MTKRKINTRVWYAPRDLVDQLCGSKHDLKAHICSTGKSPIILIDIFPKCILDREINKEGIRRRQTILELQDHFGKILSYKKLWDRIKLVVFSLEPSIDGRKEKYREARELFQDAIIKHYGKKEFLSVPFFGLGHHRFGSAKYWGAWDAQMRILSNEIRRKYPVQKELVRSIVKDYCSKINATHAARYKTLT